MRKYLWETALCYKHTRCHILDFHYELLTSRVNLVESFINTINSKMNKIVGVKLLRPTIPCRVCFWPVTWTKLSRIVVFAISVANWYTYIHIHCIPYKFGVFSKRLVYEFLIWCTWKIWYIFVGGFSWVFTSNYFFLLESVNRENTVVLTLYCILKVQWFCLTWV